MHSLISVWKRGINCITPVRKPCRAQRHVTSRTAMSRNGNVHASAKAQTNIQAKQELKILNCFHWSIDSCATFLRKGGPPQEAYKPNRLAKVVDHCNVDLGRNCFTLLPSHQFLQKCNNFNLTDYKTVIVEFSGLLIKLFDFQESFDIGYTDILC